MTKQTFAEKMAKAKADRKRNIKRSLHVAASASQIHTRCQKTQYTQPLTSTQIKIQENEKRIEEIREYLYKQYKSEGHTAENAQERKQLNAEDVALLNENHYLRNPQRTPEMDEGSDQECGGKYQHLTRMVTETTSNDDDRPCTFGEFDLEWD